MAAKLRAVVSEQLGIDPGRLTPAAFPSGAGLVAGDRGWVLADARPARALGGALVWARRRQLAALDVVVDDPDVAGLLARRAGYFATPDTTVWVVEGRTARPAEAAPLPVPPPLPADAAALADQLIAAGVDPVVEHGVLIGEVAGLEVARVVVDEGGVARLQVGVGRHDREAFAMLHGDEPVAEGLARVAAIVAEHRQPGAEPHPLNRLAPERRLRSRVVAEPALVGAEHLAPMPPVVAQPNLRDPFPAAAAGIDPSGEPVVVVCSVGIDLDLVPVAADLRAADGRGARLVLALPSRDVVPAVRDLVGLLRPPAEVVALDPPVR